MEILKIDLNEYVNVRVSRGRRSHSGERYPELGLRENGLRAAKETALSKRAGEVDRIRLKLTRGVDIGEVFLKAFLGPTARKIGPGELAKKLEIDPMGGTDVEVMSKILDYLQDETVRIAKRAKHKAEHADEPVWSEPRMFFLPEIGTKLKLSEDWEFNIWGEYRNSNFISQLNETTRGRYTIDGYSQYPVKVLAGSNLTVDRIYIRKGSSGYSSVTFFLKKDSTVEYKGRTIQFKGCRFWAKLADVNKLNVQVDWNSVPGVEGEEQT